MQKVGLTADKPARDPVYARLNFSTPMDQRPVINNDDYSKHILSLEAAETLIADANGIAGGPTLDVHGFVRLPHAIDVEDLADSEDSQARYRRNLKPFMKALTGADEVMILDINSVRRQKPAASSFKTPPPADFVHSDYTFLGADQARAMFDVSFREEPRRIAMYNMWKLLSEGPTQRPLAFCDARTLAEEDVIPSDSLFPTYGGVLFESALIRQNPNQQWYYFPDLQNDQLLVFKQGDSDVSQPRVVPHSAFDDRSAPLNAAPRVSIEGWCMAWWYS